MCRSEPDGKKWYVAAIQSDLAFASSSRLRDYVRGWRTALFTKLLEEAKAAGVTRIYVPTADEVFRAASFRTRRPLPPKSWYDIYDRTAADHGMKAVTLPIPVNIQLMYRRRRVEAQNFFWKKVGP